MHNILRFSPLSRRTNGEHTCGPRNGLPNSEASRKLRMRCAPANRQRWSVPYVLNVRRVTVHLRPEWAKLAPNMETRYAVICRALQSCLLSVSLLALAPVALACDSATPYNNCCPAGPRAPCGSHHGSAPSTAASWSCCAAVPAPLPAAADGVVVRPRDRFVSFSAPDFVAISASLESIADARRPDPAASPITLRLTLNPEPLYLLTRRLRL